MKFKQLYSVLDNNLVSGIELFLFNKGTEKYARHLSIQHYEKYAETNVLKIRTDTWGVIQIIIKEDELTNKEVIL